MYIISSACRIMSCGVCASCVEIAESLTVAGARVTILEMVDNRDRVADSLAQGVRYEQEHLTPENLAGLFRLIERKLAPPD